MCFHMAYKMTIIWEILVTPVTLILYHHYFSYQRFYIVSYITLAVCLNFPLLVQLLWYCFSPVWTLICVIKCPLWLNAEEHLLQANGFSPVWILIWMSKWLFEAQTAAHISHTFDFFSCWVWKCFVNEIFLTRYDFHNSHQLA